MAEIFFNESSTTTSSSVSISEDFDIIKYIDSNDPFNSYMIYLLSNIDTIDYTITKFAKRGDLIAKDIFDDPLYYPILVFLNPYSSFNLKEVIQVISREQLIQVFQEIQKENERVLNFNDDI